MEKAVMKHLVPALFTVAVAVIGIGLVRRTPGIGDAAFKWMHPNGK